MAPFRDKFASALAYKIRCPAFALKKLWSQYASSRITTEVLCYGDAKLVTY